jgi:hypothetical protein
MTRRLAWTALLAVVGVAVALPAHPASQNAPAQPAPGVQPAPGAQPVNPDLELAPPRPAISLLLINEPTLTISYNGDYGPMRVTGTLVEAPSQPLRVVFPGFGTRLVNWNELFSLNVVRVPTADLPIGSFTVMLSSEEGTLPKTTITTAEYTAAPTTAFVPPAPEHAVELPRGDLVLEGEPYHAMRISTDRITDIRMEPIRGSLVTMPDASVSMQVSRGPADGGGPGEGKGEENGNHERPRRDRREVAPGDETGGKVVDVPLRTLQNYRRDARRQLLSVTRSDGQIFTGRVTQVPNVQLVIDVDGTQRSFPLTNIAQFETTINLLSRPAVISP